MLVDISPDIPHIKKSIRYEMQHLMQIEKFKNCNSKSKKWILVILSIIVTCCTNNHILIRSPLKMEFLHLLWKLHGYIFNGLGEK